MDNEKIEEVSSEIKKEHEEAEGSYGFMFETMKKRPFNYRKLLIRLAYVVVSALLFGLIAAFVFAQFSKIFTADENDKREIYVVEPDPLPIEDLDVTPTPEPEVLQAEEEVREEKSYEERLQETKEDTAILAGNIREHAKEVQKSVIQVVGITHPGDWFIGEKGSSAKTCGLIIAENDENYVILADMTSIADFESFMAEVANGITRDITFIKKDPVTGLAVFLLSKKELSSSITANMKVATLGNSYNVSQGNDVIAVGSPMGYENTISIGRVTSTTNTTSLVDVQYNMLITDIGASKEGSGVLANTDGEVVGFLMQKYMNGNVVNAIPISQIKKLINKLCNNQPLAYLGITGENVSINLSSNTGIPVGVYVKSVIEESPAFNAGIQSGDVIVVLGSVTITNMEMYKTALDNVEAGQNVTLVVRRMGTDGYEEVAFDIPTGTV